jgi:ABC-2 type transport system ATP-binding protein
MIIVDQISKFYAEKRAINEMSFSIDSGEIVGLLGLNGAGKSTVLKMLGCFLMPSKGEARVGGYSIKTEPQKVRRLIGYLPDTPPLYDEMSVYSYISFVARLKGVDRSSLDTMVSASIEKTNLSDVRNTRLSDLSHGYRQRVGIAGSLVHNPKVLILDEPINGLDPIQIVEMRDLILSLKGEHTVILSSHILSEITKTCDRILVIKNGELVAEGREEDLRSGATASYEIDIQVVSPSPDFQKQLKLINGVIAISSFEDENGHWYRLQCEKDIRSNLAKYTVEKGYDLISLKKNKAELESLFMNLLGKDS